jgi:manganese transport protein
MEGFIRLRLRPWVRRLVTRLLAIVPALLVILIAGHGSGWENELIDERLFGLIVLSQVILSLQLPFAIIPLVRVTNDARQMGEFASRSWLKLLAWGATAIVIVLNAILAGITLNQWASASSYPVLVYGLLAPPMLAMAAFLAWVALCPLRAAREEPGRVVSPPEVAPVQYRRIGVGVELEAGDAAVLEQAVALARSHGAQIIALHVVEGAGADVYGAGTDDRESRLDRQRMAELQENLRRTGLEAHCALGYGNPADELVRLVQEQEIDLLVLGGHGHRFLADLALGQTVAPVLHRLKIPVLVVPGTGR